MSGMRDHVIVTIGYQFTQTVGEWVTHDEFRKTGEKPGVEGTWIVLAPSKEYAVLWAEDRLKHMKDGKITKVVAERPDGVIVELQW